MGGSSMENEAAEKLRFAHITIPDAEIEQDIAETEQEIRDYEREIAALRTLGDRMSHFRADARVEGIRKRMKFIENLRAILAERQAIRA